MSNNFIDGIPVKIAEKYKPLPKISLPQVISQRLNNQNQNASSDEQNYNFNLERNVLGRINEWKELRQREQFDRQTRFRIREEERNRLIEENKKKILSEVSYPNAEDLYSSSDDEDAKTNSSKLNSQKIGLPGHFSPSNNFNTILEPTIIRAKNANNLSNLLDATSPTTNTTTNHLATITFNKYVNNINYSDFENVTSSPFDNMELKSINDLDILAQVLNNSINLNENKTKTTETITTELIEENENITNLNEIQTSTIAVETNCNTVYGLQNYPLYSHSQIPQATYQNYITGNYQPSPHHHDHNHHQQVSYVPTIINYHDQHSNLSQLQTQPLHSTDYNSTYNTDLSNYYYNPNRNNIKNQLQIEDITNDDVGTNSKSKSKSVPDIMKELNDELKVLDEKRRIRNNSQTIDRSHKNTENDQSNLAVNNKNNQNLEYDENYKTLSLQQQNFIRNISLMGFPLQRVLRVSKLLGNDEKGIIDHLISLNDLIDLGFDEIKISEALIKSNNNKDKALDFLIS